MGYSAKYNVPLVANGRVFVASENKLTPYGLLKQLNRLETFEKLHFLSFPSPTRSF
jgi:hypothetical protein